MELDERTNYYLQRAYHLRHINQPWEPDRRRIRDVMNGGEEAVNALLGDARIGGDLTTVNLMDSGLTRLAQKLGIPPMLKVAPPIGKENEKSRERATKRQRIVMAYDDLAELDLQFPQAARWIAGYGFNVWVNTVEEYGGEYYPSVELRNPFDCWPGWFGPKQHPTEIAFVRQAEEAWVAHHYPGFAERMKQAKANRTAAGIWTPGNAGAGTIAYDASWEGEAGEVTLVEYIDMDGSHLLAPAYMTQLSTIPNPLREYGILPFSFAKRFSFDKLKGQYDEMLGMMAMMAKLNILALIASEDAVFRETNIIGEMEGVKYQRGRFATNHFQPGTRIERMGADVAFGVFQQIDRIERQMRISGQYSVIEDSQSPNSFVTGAGLDGLQASADQNVNEYQRVLARATARIDKARLAWDVKHTAERYAKPLPSPYFDETYRPDIHIGKHTATKRMYGVMAGWDEPQKIVTGLQLLQAGIIDVETFQENLTGIDDTNQIRERTRRDGAENQLQQALAARAQQGDPGAMMALVEIYNSPDKMGEILNQFFTPNEPEASPEQAQILGQGGPSQGPPPSVTTLLSQMSGTGEIEQGAQTVQTLERSM